MLTYDGGVAQLGEHLPCKQGVRGSIPLISTTSMMLDPLAQDVMLQTASAARGGDQASAGIKKDRQI